MNFEPLVPICCNRILTDVSMTFSHGGTEHTSHVMKPKKGHTKSQKKKHETLLDCLQKMDRKSEHITERLERGMLIASTSHENKSLTREHFVYIDRWCMHVSTM